MPKRSTPLITGQIYHIFNRSLDGKHIFTSENIFRRILETIDFYKTINNTIRLSFYLRWTKKRKQTYIANSKLSNKNQITNLAYCLMSNHFHLLLRQEKDGGISKFMSNFQNSITRYLNTLTKRKGHVFQSQFKAVLIENNEQLLHVSRYIHLNPLSSGLVKDFQQLTEYPWTSLREYISSQDEICHTGLILSNFKASSEYINFIKDNADYQRNLEIIKHQIIDID